ncbi:MAG: alpha/beta hydrolase [Propionibacteriaceae bacterium]|jgi:pimeloyl-ACP methyl ester carboxylesterase|nr:alpha/beta hydrolase [Propionibacteriaceae bacterium]
MDVIAADGVPVAFFDEGHGPAILILPPGLDDGGHYAPVARRLARRFRVIRLRRRSYRDDLPPGHQVTVAGELEDVKALAGAVEGPIVLVGHSSGGNLALQALAALPGRFAGAVLYEPVFVTDRPVLNPESYRAQC